MNANTMSFDVQVNIGLSIKEWRKVRRIPFNALAVRARMSKGNLSLIERGLGNPTVQTLVAICKVLRIRWQDLVDE